jgi:hypothetical protein
VTDIFVIGTGEIIVKKFAAGKLFTGEFVSPCGEKTPLSR